MANPLPVTVVCVNRKAGYNYTILETVEAGLVLVGPEVKAIRAHQISISESWVRVQGGEAYWVGAHLSCKAGGWGTVDPIRSRKLLLKKKQLRELAEATASGKTIIPLKVYFNERGLAKLEIAIAAGKKNYDKRQALKERELRHEKRDY